MIRIAAVLTLLVGALVSALLFIRVPHTDVNLDLVVSEVRFELSKAQALSEGINAHAVGASGLVNARLPAELRAAASHPVDGQSSLLLSATEPGTVTLATLIAPVGTQVNVRSNDLPRQFRLSLEHFEQEVRAGSREMPQPVKDLLDAYRSITDRRLVECYHDALQAREQALQMFSFGYLGLEARGLVERLYWAICLKIRDMCRRLPAVPEELEGLETMLSDI